MTSPVRNVTGLDFRTESPISFRAAVDIIPGPDGKHYHWRTIRNWALRGLLEAGRIGGSFCTSREACARFLQRHISPSTVIQRRRSTVSPGYATATRRLKDMGIS